MKVVHNNVPDMEVWSWMIGFVANHNKTIHDRKRKERKRNLTKVQDRS